MPKRNDQPEKMEKKHSCPYCDTGVMTATLPYCQPCAVQLHYCTRCKVMVAREATVCPHCGGELEWK